MVSLRTGSPRVLAVFVLIALGLTVSVTPSWCLYDVGMECPSSIVIASTDQSTWYDNSITINRNQTVYFRGVDPLLRDHIVPAIDFDTLDGALISQGQQTLQLQWDLSYVAGNGFVQTHTCWPLQSVSRSYSTAGTYYVNLRVDDVGTVFNDYPCYADAVFTVYVQP